MHLLRYKYWNFVSFRLYDSISSELNGLISCGSNRMSPYEALIKLFQYNRYFVTLVHSLFKMFQVLHFCCYHTTAV
jgi:hypothetical protein